MSIANNPAKRLHSILKKIWAAKADEIGYKAWSSALDVPSDNKATLLQRIAEVMLLPSEIKEKIHLCPNVNADLYLRWTGQIENAFGSLNLNAQIRSFNEHMDPTTLLGIEYCSDALARHYPEKDVDPAKLDELSKETRSLIDNVLTSILSPDLKRYMLQHLYAVLRAAEEYKLFGIKPLEHAFGNIVGSAITNPIELKAAKKTDLGKKFFKIIGYVTAILAVVNSTLDLGDRIIKFLPKSEEVIEVTSDPSCNSNGPDTDPVDPPRSIDI